MSDAFRSRWREKYTGGIAGFDGDCEFREQYPTLSTVLLGDVDQKAPGATPACTLTLFVREGRLQFSINDKNSDDAAFGVVQDPLLPMESIENELRAGRYGWKKRNLNGTGQAPRK